MFADRLKKARKRKNMYQKELAAALGVSRSAVTSWETGARVPEFETLKLLADVLEVSTDYLLGRTDDPTPKAADTPPPKQDPLSELLQRFETRNPDTLTVEEALDIVLRSDHIMFNGKPIGEMDEDILLDIRDTIVAVLKALVSKKAAAGMKGVVGNCLAAGVGAG
jgi:transcriptional regulator with XRE-family HTH domain